MPDKATIRNLHTVETLLLRRNINYRHEIYQAFKNEVGIKGLDWIGPVRFRDFKEAMDNMSAAEWNAVFRRVKDTGE